MSEYTSTREGFQRYMESSLTDPPGESSLFTEATTMPGFYHVMNNKRVERDDYTKFLDEWRGKASNYKPVVHEFLRDGHQLAARIEGTIKVDGMDLQYECFYHGKVDDKSGKLEYLIERGVYGPVGQTLA